MLPSLWAAVAGTDEITWSTRDEEGRFLDFSPEFGRIWRWKDELPERRLVCVGKHVRGRSALVSLRVLPLLVAAQDEPEKPSPVEQAVDRPPRAARPVQHGGSSRPDRVRAEAGGGGGRAAPAPARAHDGRRAGAPAGLARGGRRPPCPALRRPPRRLPRAGRGAGRARRARPPLGRTSCRPPTSPRSSAARGSRPARRSTGSSRTARRGGAKRKASRCTVRSRRRAG